MKRTTIYLEPHIEVLLKLESLRRKQPMAEVIREALRNHFASRPPQAPPGIGEFESGHADTADRAEQVLAELGLGES
ncbi:MAG: CopG family transcriptional regulator [Acidobacteriota bacterium]